MNRSLGWISSILYRNIKNFFLNGLAAHKILAHELYEALGLGQLSFSVFICNRPNHVDPFLTLSFKIGVCTVVYACDGCPYKRYLSTLYIHVNFSVSFVSTCSS